MSRIYHCADVTEDTLELEDEMDGEVSIRCESGREGVTIILSRAGAIDLAEQLKAIAAEKSSRESKITGDDYRQR